MTELADQREAVSQVIEVLQQMANVVSIRAECQVARSSSASEVCLREARECDIYVGIFGKKWGRVPKANNPRGLSATALEYEEARNFGKTRLVFVSRDRQGREPELESFLQTIGKWEGEVFWNSFSSTDELKFWVLASLAEELMKIATTDKQRATLKSYREPRVTLQRCTVGRFRFLRFNWLPQLRTVVVDLPLESVYVRLRATTEIPEADVPRSEPGLPDRPSKVTPARYARRRAAHPTGLELDDIPLKGRVNVVLGAPGSGKSTFLRNVALREARSGRLPIYAELRDYARRLKTDSRLNLESFLLESLQACGVELELRQLREWIHSGECTILLDGLDEVPDRYWRQKVSERVMDAVHAWLPDAGVVVTSRIAGYRAAPLYGATEHYTVQNLDIDSVRRFVHAWFLHMEARLKGGSVEAQRSAEKSSRSLVTAILESPGVTQLARSPLMLTILVLIHMQGNRMPESRVELYQRCSEALVESLDRARFLPGEYPPPGDLRGSDIRDLLRPLAFELHRRPQGLATSREMVEFLGSEIGRQHDLRPKESRKLAEELLTYVRERTGLLVERGLGLYGFVHMTFEEYFSGVELVESDELDAAFEKNVVPVIHAPRWREPILLAAGYLGGHSRHRAERFLSLIENAGTLFEGSLAMDLRLALRCLADNVRVGKAFQKRLLRKGSQWIRENESIALRLLSREEGFGRSVVARSLSEVILPSLSSPNGAIRAEGIRALEAMSPLSRKVTGALFRELDRGHRETRWLVGRVIRRVVSHEDLGLISGALKSKDWNTRWAAMQAYEVVVTAEDIASVERRMNSRYPAMREAATRAFFRLEPERGSQLLQRFLESKTPEVQRWAVSHASKLRRVELLPLIIPKLRHPNPAVRASAIQAIGALGSRSHLRMLRPLLFGRDQRLRWIVIEAFQDLGRPDDLREMTKLIHHRRGDLRRTAVDFIRASGKRSDLPKISKLLKDPNELVRVSVIEAYGAMGTRKDLRKILRFLDSDAVMMKYSALECLRSIGNRGDTGLVRPCLNDRDGLVRTIAAEVFVELGGPRKSEVLRQMLDEGRGPREAALRLYALKGSRKHLPLISPLLDDKSENVRRLAAEACQSILQRSSQSGPKRHS